MTSTHQLWLWLGVLGLGSIALLVVALAIAWIATTIRQRKEQSVAVEQRAQA